MTHGSLFSGIGGFDLAAQWMGWENKFHCEWNEFGQRVLNYYWPDAELFTDITKSDFKKYANQIDVLTGGFPCQPYSKAGKRRGKEDQRHLWPEMLRVIREIKPRYVVGENVRGLITWNAGLVFDEVCSDLENLRYQVAPFIIPASSVNAPHQRERIWKQGGTCLQAKAIMGMLPTPTAMDATISTANMKSTQVKPGSMHSMTLMRLMSNGKTSQLNPRFVAEMMGFPPNWTELPFQNGEQKA